MLTPLSAPPLERGVAWKMYHVEGGVVWSVWELLPYPEMHLGGTWVLPTVFRGEVPNRIWSTTVLMKVSRQKKDTNIFLDGVTLEEVEQFEYLGSDTMNSNRSLRTLQPAANDKENLVGIGRMLPSSGKEKETIKVTKDLFEKTQKVNESLIDKHNAKNTGKTKKLSNKLIQTEEKKIIIEVEDLTSEGVYWQSLFLGAMFLAAGPSEKYWEVLAERRRVALEETLKENQKLHDTIALLKEECSEYKQLLKDSEDLVETLKELLGYEENEMGDQDDSLLAN
uniref:Geminin n=1 Tax=Timema poppense TaxID=170557 RepID=A0A7R9H563_TIMPO|nr:unnamed protein product [Timema poppensis]